MSEIVDEALAFYRRFHPGLSELMRKGLAAFARDCQQGIVVVARWHFDLFTGLVNDVGKSEQRLAGVHDWTIS